MREIPGRRRKLSFRRDAQPDLLEAALHCATRWQWPVLPGVGLRPGATETDAPRGAFGTWRERRRLRGSVRGARADRDGGTVGATPRKAECACPDPDCVVPGAHPFDPELLAATTDPTMVRWWWGNRPQAPVVLATGGRAPCALSLPADAGQRALAALDHFGVRTGPVLASPTRWALLVAPYSLSELGELLNGQERVPSSLRFHGEGGYLVLPPSPVGAGRVGWVRPPRPADAAPFLPEVATLVDALVRASVDAPGEDSRLAY